MKTLWQRLIELKKVCSVCQGTKRVECDCDKHFFRRCDLCEENGYIEQVTTIKIERVTKCDHLYCQQGQVLCNACYGQENQEECASCGGTGFSLCPICLGTMQKEIHEGKKQIERIICPVCQGKKKRFCVYCGGKKQRQCQCCNGAGQVWNKGKLVSGGLMLGSLVIVPWLGIAIFGIGTVGMVGYSIYLEVKE